MGFHWAQTQKLVPRDLEAPAPEIVVFLQTFFSTSPFWSSTGLIKIVWLESCSCYLMSWSRTCVVYLHAQFRLKWRACILLTWMHFLKARCVALRFRRCFCFPNSKMVLHGSWHDHVQSFSKAFVKNRLNN